MMMIRIVTMIRVVTTNVVAMPRTIEPMMMAMPIMLLRSTVLGISVTQHRATDDRIAMDATLRGATFIAALGTRTRGVS
jgi:hypothetical protein